MLFGVAGCQNTCLSRVCDVRSKSAILNIVVNRTIPLHSPSGSSSVVRAAAGSLLRAPGLVFTAASLVFIAVGLASTGCILFVVVATACVVCRRRGGRRRQRDNRRILKTIQQGPAGSNSALRIHQLVHQGATRKRGRSLAGIYDARGTIGVTAGPRLCSLRTRLSGIKTRLSLQERSHRTGSMLSFFLDCNAVRLGF